MFKKGNKLYSILSGRCPRCHAEHMYINKNPYKLSTILLMNERCSNCNVKYKMEPSFFYGSMYVSYPVGIAFATAAFVISYMLFEFNILASFFCIVFTIIVFLPIILRLSRNIWINIFMHYDPKLAKQK